MVAAPIAHNHYLLHVQSTLHLVVLSIKRTLKMVKREEPLQKIMNLVIAAETEEDQYGSMTRVKYYV
jgi:hypothetical protein